MRKQTRIQLRNEQFNKPRTPQYNAPLIRMSDAVKPR